MCTVPPRCTHGFNFQIDQDVCGALCKCTLIATLDILRTVELCVRQLAMLRLEVYLSAGGGVPNLQGSAS
jgi:hypothetical protein